MNFLNYIFVMLFSVSAAAQDTIPSYPKGYFGPPVDVPFLLAGNFGEPRSSHFHMGIDIRTLEKEGLPVYALADGYVSRIGVSPYGYGNVVYITYPNGFTSVYGHLQRFNISIATYVRQQQYAREQFAVDFTLKPTDIPVHKGELVAYSGNTGGSGGPHLHFEIRDMMERSVNALNFGYQSADHIAPSIGALKFYPMGDKRFTAEAFRAAVLPVNGIYTLKTGLQKLNTPSVGIAINTFDKMDERIHSVCPYDVKMYDGDSLIFEYTMDRVSFDNIRDVIAQIDYPIFMHEGSRSFQKCFIEHNNNIPAFYHHVRNHGIIDLSDGEIHHIKIVSADFMGNKATVAVQLQYDAKSLAFKPRTNHYMLALSPDVDNVIDGDGFKATIPGKALLDSVFINYSSTAPKSPSVFSNVVKIGESYDLLGFFSISLKALNLIDSMKDKAIMVWRNAAGGTAVRSGKWEGDILTAKSREFGTYYIVLDTTPPKITPINILNGKNMHVLKVITLSIRDNLSGISDFHGYIDGKWQLMEMDGKSAVVRMQIPSDLTSGEHNFRLSVTDDRNNRAEYSVTFIY